MCFRNVDFYATTQIKQIHHRTPAHFMFHDGKMFTHDIRTR